MPNLCLLCRIFASSTSTYHNSICGTCYCSQHNFSENNDCCCSLTDQFMVNDSNSYSFQTIRGQTPWESTSLEFWKYCKRKTQCYNWRKMKLWVKNEMGMSEKKKTGSVVLSEQYVWKKLITINQGINTSVLLIIISQFMFFLTYQEHLYFPVC